MKPGQSLIIQLFTTRPQSKLSNNKPMNGWLATTLAQMLLILYIGTMKEGTRGALGPTIRSKIWLMWSKMWPKRRKMNLFGVWSFMKIYLGRPSLDHNEQNCFGTPNFFAYVLIDEIDNKLFPTLVYYSC